MPAYNGNRITESELVHTGSGYLLGYLISHAESSAQAVVFYDNTAASGTVIQRVYVSPESSPRYLRFPIGISFATGLFVNPGNCEVSIWASGK